MSQLALLPRHDDGNDQVPVFAIANQLLDVGLRDAGLVLVIDHHHWIERIARSITKGEQIVTMLGEFVPYPHTRPRADIFCEIYLLFLANTSDLGHFFFEELVLLFQLVQLVGVVFNPVIEVVCPSPLQV